MTTETDAQIAALEREMRSLPDKPQQTDERPDPLLYPERVECPHCRKTKKVVFRHDPIEGWRAHVEEHEIVEGQATFNGRKWTNVRYACPASLAVVSSWEDIR